MDVRAGIALCLLVLGSTKFLRSMDCCWWRRRVTSSLGIVDPVAGKLLASVPEGGITGHEVTASPDGRLAYVPIYGNSGVGKPGTDGTNMVVIDIASAQRSWATWISDMACGRTCRFSGPRTGCCT